MQLTLAEMSKLNSDERSSVESVSSVSIDGIRVTAFDSVEAFAGAVIPETGKIRFGMAVAMNAEKVIRARSDVELRELLSGDVICFPDGIAVVWTMRKKGVRTARVPGVDVWTALMKRAGRLGTRVFILGGREEVTDRTVRRLSESFGVSVVGSASGYFREQQPIIDSIASSGAELVTVAMGSPTQERFIQACRGQIPNAFYMGVGGTYDVFVGDLPRAPRWMQAAGLEWLFRLARQPSRVLRQRALLLYARDHLLGRL